MTTTPKLHETQRKEKVWIKTKGKKIRMKERVFQNYQCIIYMKTIKQLVKLYKKAWRQPKRKKSKSSIKRLLA